MSRKVKKMLGLSLSMMMMLASFTGCTQQETGSNGGKTNLSFGIWDKNQQPTMQALCDAYTAVNPNVSIEIQITPYKGGEYWTKLEASMTGGTAPDVFWNNGLHVENYVDGGMVLPLNEYIEKESFDLNVFPTSLVGLYNIEGEQYAVPKDFDTNAVWYNKEIFDAAGVAYPTDDWTWDDMIETAKKLTDKEKGIYGIAAPLDFQTCYYNTIFSSGGYILDEGKATTGYNDPNTQKGIQCWIDLINEGISPTLAETTDTSADSMFESGKLAMIWAGSYMTPEYVQNDVVKGKIDLVEAPTFEGKQGNVINGLGYSVYAKSKQKDEAAKFALWLGGEEAMKIQGQSGVVISARNDAQKYFAESNPELNLQAYTNQSQIATALPCCKVSSQLFDIEAKYLKLAFSNEMTVEEACAKIASEVEPLLADMNK